MSLDQIVKIEEGVRFNNMSGIFMLMQDGSIHFRAYWGGTIPQEVSPERYPEIHERMKHASH